MRPLAVIKNLYEQRGQQNRPNDHGVEEYFAKIISQASPEMVRTSCGESFV